MTKNPPSLSKAAPTAEISKGFSSNVEQQPERHESNMNNPPFQRNYHQGDSNRDHLEHIHEGGESFLQSRASAHPPVDQSDQALPSVLETYYTSLMLDEQRKKEMLLRRLKEQSEPEPNQFFTESSSIESPFAPCIVRSNPPPLAFRPFPPQSQAPRGAFSDNSENILMAIPPVPPKEPLQEQQGRPSAEDYAIPFCKFLTDYPTVFHATAGISKELGENGYIKLSERDGWSLKKGGKYYVERNGSSVVAFAVGKHYEVGNGAAILAGHIDALTARLKPVSNLRTKAGFVQLGVAPYAGALNQTWWDRDLGVGGRVIVKESSGKIVTKLVKLGWPIARIPTLAPHFGAVANGPFNKETQMVPIIGLDNSDIAEEAHEANYKSALLGGEGAFTSTQPPRLVKAIAKELGISDYSSILNWELELFDFQPATLGGIDKEFIFAGRIDDKLCSWSAYQALISSTQDLSTSSQIKVVGLFDNEEIGSLLRQGARGNFLPSVLSRVVDSFSPNGAGTASLLSQTFANSFLVSSDVVHAVNPNFLNVYMENHAPRLNVGLVVHANPNGTMATDAVSTAVLQRVADKSGQKLQIFQVRNDSRSGGTVGPMLSAKTGIRTVDAGIPQLSMHSIRATTGSKDPGLGIFIFQGFLDHFEEVDKEFRD